MVKKRSSETFGSDRARLCLDVWESMAWKNEAEGVVVCRRWFPLTSSSSVLCLFYWLENVRKTWKKRGRRCFLYFLLLCEWKNIKKYHQCVLCEWFVSNSIETFEHDHRLTQITSNISMQLKIAWNYCGTVLYHWEAIQGPRSKAKRPFYKHDHNLMDPDLSQFPSESKSGMATWTGVQLNSGKRRPSLLLTNIKMDEQSVRSCHNSPAFFHACLQTYTNHSKA